jgi:hypothetical protein
LDQEFGFDNSASSGLEIQFINGTTPVTLNALEHRINLGKQIATLPCHSPNALGEVHELILERPR